MQHSQSLATPNPELAINVHVVEYFVQETTKPLSTYTTTTIFADIRPALTQAEADSNKRAVPASLPQLRDLSRPGQLGPANPSPTLSHRPTSPRPEPELNPQKDIRILIQVRNNCVPPIRPDPTRYAALEIVTFLVESLAL
ncbi:uncharacterized protein BKA55DRAFT_691594 [Fusarium redolens]|jgi:hypothetical protein|uniref:Uncharacterized protein n=1 Tax=Fusarium redolens TaxID=48865 RepID=A0A9P9GZ59_FUSRE|nr:uncharacterized protein BKA55DRAFT_691594 [Fusarium redolens]KAH7247502.1 hypothetical protein BKA55DRAFT_691594 [Fusarium redolens]